MLLQGEEGQDEDAGQSAPEGPGGASPGTRAPSLGYPADPPGGKAERLSGGQRLGEQTRAAAWVWTQQLARGPGQMGE